MNVLGDTNIGLRWVQRRSAESAIVRHAIRVLIDRGDRLVMSSQNFVEFWGVATRPSDVNGLGLQPERAEQLLRKLEIVFETLPDDPATHPIWRELVVSLGVRGRQVHDARLAAVMIAHGISHILTFNVTDFARFPEINAIDPRMLGDESESNLP